MKNERNRLATDLINPINTIYFTAVKVAELKLFVPVVFIRQGTETARIEAFGDCAELNYEMAKLHGEVACDFVIQDHDEKNSKEHKRKTIKQTAIELAVKLGRNEFATHLTSSGYIGLFRKMQALQAEAKEKGIAG
jgi:hypothetical protein